MTSAGGTHLTVSQAAHAMGWSERDVRLVELLAQNTARADVAARLGCSVTTVDRRLAIMRERLGVRTTTEVIVHAVRHGAI